MTCHQKSKSCRMGLCFDSRKPCPCPRADSCLVGFADQRTLHILMVKSLQPGVSLVKQQQSQHRGDVHMNQHTLAATVSTSSSRASLMGRLAGRRMGLLSSSIELGLDSLLCKAELALTPFKRSNTDFLPRVMSSCTDAHRLHHMRISNSLGNACSTKRCLRAGPCPALSHSKLCCLTR